MYRDKLVDNGSDHQDAPSPSTSPGKGHASTSKPLKPTPTSGSTKDGGLLGPLLGLLRRLGIPAELPFRDSVPDATPTTSQIDFQPITTISSPHTFNNSQPVLTATPAVNTIVSSQSLSKEQVEFAGIFFR